MGKPIAATYESYDSPGYFAAVRARAVVDVPPDALYELLAVSMAKLAPSSVEDVHDTVVRSDSEGRQLLRRTFCTPWRFLVLSGRHRVVADVHHSRPELTITTALAEKGFYTALEITWTVAPEVPGKQHAPHSSNTGVGRTPAALLSLDFRITPSVLPPGPFVPMLRGMIESMAAASVDEVARNAHVLHWGVLPPPASPATAAKMLLLPPGGGDGGGDAVVFISLVAAKPKGAADGAARESAQLPRSTRPPPPGHHSPFTGSGGLVAPCTYLLDGGRPPAQAFTPLPSIVL